MLAWQETGDTFYTVTPDGAIVDELGALVARPRYRTEGVVLAGGGLASVHVDEGRCVLGDPMTGELLLELPVSGRLEDVRVAGSVIATLARAPGHIEQAWFDLAGSCLERILRPDDLPAIATRDPHGTVIEPMLALRTLRAAERFERDLTAYGVAVATAPSGPSVRFYATSDGLVSAHGPDDRVVWLGILRPHRFVRLDLSGDGRILFASGDEHVVAWDAETGALLGEQGFAAPGRLYPAPRGEAAVWLGEGRAERVVLGGERAPPVRLRHPVVLSDRELVVEDDPTGTLTSLVRALADHPTGPRALDGFAVGGLRLSRSGDGAPRTMLRPRRIDVGERVGWIDGMFLRSFLDEAKWRAAERAHLVARAAMRENAELEAAIRANPDDPRPRMVYGDWLLEQGDPRGELVSVQAQLLSRPHDRELNARQTDLVNRYAPIWLDGFCGEGSFEKWNLGLVDEISTSRLTDDGWQKLIAHPVLRHIRTLIADVLSLESVVEWIERFGYPSSLRRLVLDEVDGLVRGTEPAVVTDRLFATVPRSRLRSLAISGPVPASLIRAYAPALAQLRELRIDVLDGTVAELRDVLPGLEVIVRKPLPEVELNLEITEISVR